MAEIKEQLDISLSAQNVWNRVHEIGMFGRVARKKSYVNKVNRSKRFKVAKEMLQKPRAFGTPLYSLTNENSNFSARRVEE